MTATTLQIIIELVVLVVIFILLMIDSPKRPSHIKSEFTKYSPDSYVVSVATASRTGRPYYQKFIFTKRKNGKYRLKHSVFDWIYSVASVAILTGLYAVLVYSEWNLIVSKPKNEIPHFLVLLFIILSIIAIANYAKIKAAILMWKAK